MTLVLKLTRDMAKFEVSDDDAETVVAITVNDDQDALLRKLKRVIALVEGEAPPTLVLPPPAVVRSVMDAKMPADREAQTGNGWAAAYGPPEVPERLQGEVELIPPGEDA